MRILLPIAFGLLLLAAACGGDDDDGGNGGNGGDGNGDAATPTAPADEIQSQPAPPQEIGDEVTEPVDGVLKTQVNDLVYELNNLRAPLDETTTIEITNVGTAIHNFRIAGVDGEWNTDDDVVIPDLLSGGDTGVVDFTPSLAGTYTFRCDIHPTSEGGVIVVG
jgi:plastocyanin